MLRKLGQSYQFAIPREIVNRMNLHVNDYLDIRIAENKIIIEPQVMVPRDQAYFYTPEWQKEEKEAENDIKEGRVTKTKNLKELLKKLDQ